jgi:hypothetical protein
MSESLAAGCEVSFMVVLKVPSHFLVSMALEGSSPSATVKVAAAAGRNHRRAICRGSQHLISTLRRARRRVGRGTELIGGMIGVIFHLNSVFAALATLCVFH